MNAPESSFPDLAIPAEFQTRFDAQRGAFIKAPEPSRAERLADLKALSNLLKENQSAIVAAIDADYGGRSEFETMFGEMFASLDGAPRRAKGALRAGCDRAGGASMRSSIPAPATA